MPLNLTLSPQAGRGNLPHRLLQLEKNGAAYPLRPACWEKVAGRPDEGQRGVVAKAVHFFPHIHHPAQGMFFIISWVIGIMLVLR
jgi:hypothetical protein